MTALAQSLSAQEDADRFTARSKLYTLPVPASTRVPQSDPRRCADSYP